MKTVVVIPTYNEKKNMEILIPSIFSIVPDINILIADDNSPDGTADVVMGHQKRYKNLRLLKRQKKQGLGMAYLHAFSEVLKDEEVDVVVMMDADFSHDPRALPILLSKINGQNVVIGSRYVKGGNVDGWELWRRIMSKFGNLYCRSITGMPINDCTGGFNAISSGVLRKIDLESVTMSGYAFIMGLKHAIYASGAELVEVPITFKDRVEGVSKISNKIIKEGIIAPWKMYLNHRMQKLSAKK